VVNESNIFQMLLVLIQEVEEDSRKRPLTHVHLEKWLLDRAVY